MNYIFGYVFCCPLVTYICLNVADYRGIEFIFYHIFVMSASSRYWGTECNGVAARVAWRHHSDVLGSGALGVIEIEM